MKRLVIDTETTGLSPRINRTLTVGMLLVDVTEEFLNILDSHHIFIKHNNYNATPEAMAVNKINLEDHNNRAVPPQDACCEINNFIEKHNLSSTPLVGHNISFDKGFLGALFERGSTEQRFHWQSFDTMHIWNSLKRAGSVPYHLRANLQTVAGFFEIDYARAHDALADCHITAQVYHRMLELIRKKDSQVS